jgi:hypothetical protein
MVPDTETGADGADENKAADGVASFNDAITDENQQVMLTVVSSKNVDGDLFKVAGNYADGSACEGEMLSSGGRKPEKGQEWKLQLEARTDVPTVVPVLDEDNKPTKKTEIKLTDRKVVVGYFVK